MFEVQKKSFILHILHTLGVKINTKEKRRIPTTIEFNEKKIFYLLASMKFI